MALLYFSKNGPSNSAQRAALSSSESESAWKISALFALYSSTYASSVSRYALSFACAEIFGYLDVIEDSSSRTTLSGVPSGMKFRPYCPAATVPSWHTSVGSVNANLPSTTGTRVSICSPTVTCTWSTPSGTTVPVISVTSDTCAQDATTAATPAAQIIEFSFILSKIFMFSFISFLF